MKITEVRVRETLSGGKMKAIASVTFDDEFVVHDIKVIDGEGGMFIAMPSRMLSDGRYADIAHPLNTDFREALKGAVLNSYEKLVAKSEEEKQDA